MMIDKYKAPDDYALARPHSLHGVKHKMLCKIVWIIKKEANILV